MEKVSVIIPTYNDELYISDAVNSVLEQTYKNIEIIIIDDGSTDKTKDIINTYNNKHINYLFQENKGAASARNIGLKKATGKYITFLDADDLWLKTKIEKQIKILKKFNYYSFVYTDAIFVDKYKNMIYNYPRKIKIMSGNILFNFIKDYFLLLPTIMLRSKCISKVGLFDENLKVGEDFDFLLRLTKFYKGYGINKKLYIRRVHEKSLSRQDYKNDSVNDIKILKNFINKNPVLYKKNKYSINKRIAYLHYKFGYRLLNHNNSREAFCQFIISLKYHFNIKSLKNIILCFFPNNIRNSLKNLINKKGGDV